MGCTATFFEEDGAFGLPKEPQGFLPQLGSISWACARRGCGWGLHVLFCGGCSSFLCETGSAVGARGITAGGKYHASWNPATPRVPRVPTLTSATGTPSGGRHCRRTSWSWGTSLLRGSWSKFLRRSGERERARHIQGGQAELETEVPHSSHKVAVHTQGTFTGTHLTFTWGVISFSKVGPYQLKPQ